MQNDFVDGALGTPEAVEIVPSVAEKIRSFDGKIIATRDTHGEDYLESEEGRHLPVIHCVKGTMGWELCREVEDALEGRMSCPPIDKPTFGSTKLGEYLKELDQTEGPVEEVELVGLCTDICVISNALLVKAFLPNAVISVDASCCAGVTPLSHGQALEAMKVCQIEVR